MEGGCSSCPRGELNIAINTFDVFLIIILAKALVERGEELEPAASHKTRAFNPQCRQVDI